ncbi:hypothetical protein CMI47_20875 [Candidatus Pacearchaeota archaeon]|nr:hypothetical protein [Candidatus Pacearchaeota archaeon]
MRVAWNPAAFNANYLRICGCARSGEGCQVSGVGCLARKGWRWLSTLTPDTRHLDDFLDHHRNIDGRSGLVGEPHGGGEAVVAAALAGSWGCPGEGRRSAELVVIKIFYGLGVKPRSIRPGDAPPTALQGRNPGRNRYPALRIGPALAVGVADRVAEWVCDGERSHGVRCQVSGLNYVYGSSYT